MRLAVCALSAVLLSGCSWFGGGYGSTSAGYHGQSGATYYGTNGRRIKDPCIVYSPTQPVPPGCHPSEVVLANSGGSYGGFPQKPDFSNYATGGYGSHASNVGNMTPEQRKLRHARKPRLRGTFSIGFEKATSGEIFDHSKVPGVDPELTYNPDDFAEAETSGTPSTGNITTMIYTADHPATTVPGQDGDTFVVNKPTISWSDVYSTPLNLKAGFEYIASPHVTAFANANYAYSEGNSGEAVTIDSTLLRHTISQEYDTDTLAPVGAPLQGVSFIPNARIGMYDFNFNDMERYGFEVGGRYYFNPAVDDDDYRTVTPFIGASAGMDHYNETNFEITQRQLFFQRAFDSNLQTMDYYRVPGPNARVQVADSQWVKNGSLTVGAEWQVTPKWGMALESGLKWEEGREYSNGAEAEDRISVPLTLRGSFNF